MNYPVWVVPHIGTPWVVGIIAIFHVMIAHFAVGGGLYLAVATAKARRENRQDWLPIIQRHSRFFLILTGVYGTVSGVGIWFSIGLIQPEATSALIHNFVFGWAIEWAFFIIELSCALVFYYTWNRVPDKIHQQVANVYAVSSLLTLVIINGILTFMLTPGHSWLGVSGISHNPLMFWLAFFNPTYFPSLMLRILSCLALAGVWGLVSLSCLEKGEGETARDQMIKWSSLWLLPAFLLMPVAFFWYKTMVPASNQELAQLGIATIGSGMFTQVTRIVLISLMSTSTIAAVAYIFAYKSPKDFTLGHALSVLFLALAATGSSEWAREAIRKPYVIGSYMYSNGIRVKDVPKITSEGYAAQSIWAPKSSDPVIRGRFIFRGECMSCHTTDGYRSMKGFLAQRDEKAIANIMVMLRDYKPDSPYHKFMPPLVVTDQEAEDLKAYLLSLKGLKPTATVAELTSQSSPQTASTAAPTTPAAASTTTAPVPAIAPPAVSALTAAPAPAKPAAGISAPPTGTVAPATGTVKPAAETATPVTGPAGTSAVPNGTKPPMSTGGRMLLR